MRLPLSVRRFGVRFKHRVWRVVGWPFRELARISAGVWTIVLAGLLALNIATGTLVKWEYEDRLAEYRRVMSEHLEDVEELAHLRGMYALAVEFDLSPLVVEAFYSEALSVSEEEGDWKTWRFVNSPEFLAYLMCSIVKVESNGDRFAIGDNGRAIGLTQIWLTTARDYEPDVTREQLFNPVVQARIATQHFVRLLERYDGNHARAVISWNRGEGRVDQLLTQGLSPENGYVYKVYRAALIRNSEVR